jgi:chemotaxis protein CheZ
MVSRMDENTKLPVIHLELTTGVFKIKAEDAIYEIEVKADSSLTQVVEKIVEKEVVVEKDTKKEPESTKEAAEEGVSDQFYKEISEEMFNEIGKMARELSISIKTPLDEDMKNVDISQAGVDLEGAKGKLQDIVEMTEKATMVIMDISENIQEGCDEIKKNLTEIQKINFIGRLEKEAQKEEQEKLIAAIESTDKLIKNIIINISRILESLSFQDLSGQQIKKILSVLSSVQVQLLSMLVTFGVKLKKKEEYESLAVGEKEDLVHQEVDKMKSKVSDEVWEDEAEGEGPLNQNAVDDLLAELGF